MTEKPLPPIRSEAAEWERQQRLTTKEQREARRERAQLASLAYWDERMGLSGPKLGNY